MGGGGKGGKSVTVGYKYYAGVHMVLCHSTGLARVNGIKVGEKVAYKGNMPLDRSVYINKPELFGGEKREGGVVGFVRVWSGKNNQPVDPYLERHTGYAIAYRGVVSLVLESTYLAANNPYIKPWLVNLTCRHVPPGANPNYQTPATTLVTEEIRQPTGGSYENVNPVYVIWQVLIHSGDRWGLGLRSSDIIDPAVWNADAKTVFDEGYGVSVLWANDMSAADFIEMILRHIDAALYLDQTSGKFRLKLIREDYDVDKLPIADSSVIKEVKELNRPMWGELTTQLTVTYRDGGSGKYRPITQHNMAAQAIQGTNIPADVRYEAFNNRTIANRVVARDLKQLSTRLLTATLLCNRKASTWNIGDVIKVNLPEENLFNRVFRIKEKDLGRADNPVVRLSVIEDVFSAASATIGTDVGDGWVPPDNTPTPITKQKFLELPYWHVIQQIGDTPSAKQDLGTSSVVGTVAEQPSGLTLGTELYESTDGGSTYEFTNTGGFTSSALLFGELKQFESEDSWVLLKSIVGPLDIQLNATCLIGEEWCWVYELDLENSRMKVRRGIIDTTRKQHPVDTTVWFTGVGNYYPVNEKFLNTADVAVKQLPRTTGGTLSINDATPISQKLTDRINKPYQCVDIKINGAVPTLAPSEGELRFTWKYRDRTAMTDRTPLFESDPHQDAEIGIGGVVASSFLVISSGNDTNTISYEDATQVFPGHTVPFGEALYASDGTGKIKVVIDGDYPYDDDLKEQPCHDKWEFTIDYQIPANKPETAQATPPKTLTLPAVESDINIYTKGKLITYQFTLTNDVPAGQELLLSLKAPSASMTLYLLKGAQPSTTVFDHKATSAKRGDTIFMNLSGKTAGTYYIGVQAIDLTGDAELNVRIGVPIPTGLLKLGAKHAITADGPITSDQYDYYPVRKIAGLADSDYDWIQATSVTVTPTGNKAGEPDLYIAHGRKPKVDDYDEFSDSSGADSVDDTTFLLSSSDDIWVGVHAFSEIPSGSGYEVKLEGVGKKFRPITKADGRLRIENLINPIKPASWGIPIQGEIWAYTLEAGDIGKTVTVTTGSTSHPNEDMFDLYYYNSSQLPFLDRGTNGAIDYSASSTTTERLTISTASMKAGDQLYFLIGKGDDTIDFTDLWIQVTVA